MNECSNCMWFRVKRELISDESLITGSECMLNPPTPQFGRPEVESDDYCSFWEEREIETTGRELTAEDMRPAKWLREAKA